MAMEECSITKGCFHCKHIGNNSGDHNKYYCDLDMNLEIVILNPPYHNIFRNFDCPLKNPNRR